MHLTRHTVPLTLATLLIAGACHAAQPGAPASVTGDGINNVWHVATP